MIVKITNKTFNSTFDEIEPGELFMTDIKLPQNIFMKIDTVHDYYDKNAILNAVLLNGGTLWEFDPDMVVYLVKNAELIV